MSVAAANPCIPKSPTIYTLQSLEDFEWIKTPNQGDIATLRVYGGSQDWVFQMPFEGTIDGFNFIEGACRGAWVRAATPINVLILGADPTGETDSYPAIQAALDYATGYLGKIYIPAGLYKLSATLVPPDSSITIEGEQVVNAYDPFENRGTVLQPMDDATLSIVIDFGTNVGPPNFCAVRNLTINGNYKAETGIRFTQMTLIENVQITRCTGCAYWGINFVNRSILRNCEGSYCDIGFRLSGVQPTVMFVQSCLFYVNRRGVEILAGNPEFDNCVIESNTAIGLYAETAIGNVAVTGPFYVRNCWFEDQPKHIVSGDTGTGSVQGIFTECNTWIAAPKVAKDVELDNANSWRFHDCDFNGTGTHTTTLTGDCVNCEFINTLPGSPPPDPGGAGTYISSNYSQVHYMRPGGGGTGRVYLDAGGFGAEALTIGASLLTGRTYGLGMFNGGGGSAFFALRDRNAAANRTTWTDDGKVGIATDLPTETLHINGSTFFEGAIRVRRVSVFAPYNIAINDYLVINLTVGVQAVTLELAATAGAGKVIVIKSSGGATTTVTPQGGDTIDLNPTDTLLPWACGTYISNGVSDWSKISST